MVNRLCFLYIDPEFLRESTYKDNKISIEDQRKLVEENVKCLTQVEGKYGLHRENGKVIYNKYGIILIYTAIALNELRMKSRK